MQREEQTDGSLMAAIAGGDEVAQDALLALYDRYRGPLTKRKKSYAKAHGSRVLPGVPPLPHAGRDETDGGETRGRRAR